MREKTSCPKGCPPFFAMPRCSLLMYFQYTSSLAPCLAKNGGQRQGLELIRGSLGFRRVQAGPRRDVVGDQLLEARQAEQRLEVFVVQQLIGGGTVGKLDDALELVERGGGVAELGIAFGYD